MTRSTKKAGTGAQGHALCRPASPGAIIQKAISDSGRDAEWLRRQLGCSKRVLREILDDTEPLSLLEALAIGGVLERPDLKLIAAQIACQKWDDEEDRRMEGR